MLLGTLLAKWRLFVPLPFPWRQTLNMRSSDPNLKDGVSEGSLYVSQYLGKKNTFEVSQPRIRSSTTRTEADRAQ